MSSFRQRDGHSRAVCLPGFGDTAAYWSDLFELWLLSPSFGIEWPGIWTSSATPEDPVEEFIRQAIEASSSDDVLVGHSMGARAAIEIAAAVRPRGLILLAPAVGPNPNFLASDKLNEWLSRGVRPTFRPDPHTGERRMLDVSSHYATGWLHRAQPDCSELGGIPTLTVLMSDDHDANAAAEVVLAPHSVIINVEGPHRWWESREATSSVGVAIRPWARSVLAGAPYGRIEHRSRA